MKNFEDVKKHFKENDYSGSYTSSYTYESKKTNFPLLM